MKGYTVFMYIFIWIFSAPEMRRDGISRSLRPRKGNTNDIANPLTSTRPGLALMTGFSVPMQENSNESALTDNGFIYVSSKY